MSHSIRRLLAILLLLAASAAQPLHAEVRAWLDRDRIQLGETVTLNVEGSSGAEAPDFSVLDRDFERLGSSSRSEFSISNGQRRSRTLWAVVLEPREAGLISVPAFTLGGERTEPLRLTVLPAQAVTPGDTEVFMEVEAEPRRPFVQQQVRYTVRLFYAVTLLEGDLAEPTADGAEVRRLGPDASFQRTLGQRRYNVVERRYAVIPQRSGDIEISGPRFRGRALSAQQRGWMGRDRSVSARGDAIRLDVQPRADSGPGPWLPAAELRLEDISGELPQRIELGEPVTLSLRVSARGLGASQLPRLELPPVDGARLYPDQPSTRESHDGPWLLGEVERRFAVVATEPGMLEIPPLSIEWWNTELGRSERSELPGWRFEVVDPASPGQGAAGASDTGTGQPPVAPDAGPWRWVSLGLALAWLLTLAAWARTRRRVPAVPQPAVRVEPDTRRARLALERALVGDSPEVISRCLLDLARAAGRPAAGLDALAEGLDDPQQVAAVRALQRWRYAPVPDDGSALAGLRAAFARAPAWRLPPAAAARDTTHSLLPPLYPD